MAQPIDLTKWVELGAAKEAGEVAAMVACALAVGAAVLPTSIAAARLKMPPCLPMLNLRLST